MVLEAANGDPLRAQEIEEHISQLWWQRWHTHRAAKIEAQEARNGG